MNIYGHIIAAFCLSVLLLFQGPELRAQLSYEQQKTLSVKLDEYVKAIERETTETKCAEVDFLVASSTDSLVRQFIAIHLYGRYMNSPVMGDEAVAIHMTDYWFSPGKVSFQNELDLINAKVFADFNRESLIDCNAPSLELQKMDGEVMDFRPGSDGRPCVLFFYDVDCPVCRVESMMLKQLLSAKSYDLDFAAIYTKDKYEEWTAYVSDRFDFSSENIRVLNFWDPDFTSGFEKKYGILQTPSTFLVDASGRIIGRRLDPEALITLLDTFCVPNVLNYGDEDSEQFFDYLFAAFADSLTADDVKGFADSIWKKCDFDGKGAEDPRMVYSLKQTLGDYLYYISNKAAEAYRMGTEYLVDRYILSEPELWNTADDTLKIVGYANMLKELYSKPLMNAKFPKVKGVTKCWKNAVIIFHTEGCQICEQELAAASSLPKNVKVITVNVDRVLEEHPDIAAALFDTYDLSTLPFLVRTDRKGRVVRKYFTLIGQ